MLEDEEEVKVNFASIRDVKILESWTRYKYVLVFKVSKYVFRGYSKVFLVFKFFLNKLTKNVIVFNALVTLNL